MYKQLKIKVMNTKNESYESPQVEIIEVQVEKGFAQSVGAGGTIDPWG